MKCLLSLFVILVLASCGTTQHPQAPAPGVPPGWAEQPPPGAPDSGLTPETRAPRVHGRWMGTSWRAGV